MSCAALLSMFFYGVTLEQLDRTKVYEIPKSVADQMTFSQRVTGRACALRHGIRYRIRND